MQCSAMKCNDGAHEGGGMEQKATDWNSAGPLQ